MLIAQQPGVALSPVDDVASVHVHAVVEACRRPLTLPNVVAGGGRAASRKRQQGVAREN